MITLKSLGRLFSHLLLLSFFFSVWSCQNEQTGPITPQKLEILFLGHNSEHHNSAEYLPLLAAALSPKGINFSYTPDPKDLTTENLSQYDGLIIYANHDSIGKNEEKALLSFVKKGGALLPIHCASYCFRNSDEYVKLVGAQFKSHGEGTFTAEIVNSEHPIMQGFTPFETWDETYVHDLHTSDRTILMERVEGDHREPWTWTKEYGKGRMFYTAFGHDERTWGNAGFHQLMENGILWAVGEQKSEAFKKLSFPKLEYTEAVIPNYEKRDPPPLLQGELSAEESQKMIQIPPGFELDLFAAEPDIINPISLSWDERGRLWVIETKDYPNDISPEEREGNDVIKILEDTDGDGKADKFTVFADQLSVPTSLVFANDGVIVAQAPHFLFLKDTDGDDKADVREIIMDGWGIYDTHAGPSNLKYGFDNQIWGVLGYSGFEGNVGGETHKFGQGIYRFLPDGSKLEFINRTSNNTWGLGFSETNDIFISTANNTHSGYMGIPLKYLKDVEGLNHKEVKKIDSHYSFHTNTRNFRQVDVWGGFTAAAGHNLYTARSYPKEYWNRIALVCEPTGHLLHKAILEKDGAGFIEKDGWNLLASSDEWVSPVHAEVGPDGAVWILDWYNFIIQHNPLPEGFELGKGNAHINPLRDKQHGRIYRLSYKAGKATKNFQLSKDNTSELISALKSDNMLWRMHAQRMLVERGNKDVEADLCKIIADKSVDEIGLNSPAVHALWALHGLNLIAPIYPKTLAAVEEALRHPAAGVRKAAIQVLPKSEKTLEKFIAVNSFKDADPHTRLAALISLSDFPASDQLANELYSLSQDQSIQKDNWLAKAFYAALVKHHALITPILVEKQPDLFKKEDKNNQGDDQWQDPDLDDSNWSTIPTPMRWQDSKIEELGEFDGTVWYRHTIDLTGAQANKKAILHLGPIDDTDDAYINGKRIGGMIRKWSDYRSYPIPRGLLKKGINSIAVKVLDTGGRGGIFGRPTELYIQAGEEQINLAGDWKYKIESTIRSGKSAFADATILERFAQHYGSTANNAIATFEDEEASLGREIKLSTIRDQMKYDVEAFTVKAGETVTIVFTNNDGMQHNILICEPGSLQEIGEAADKLATLPDGPALDYIPQLSTVFLASRLINPGETVKLNFTVPQEAGDYPYICTFPGHWKTMNGVMKVVKGQI